MRRASPFRVAKPPRESCPLLGVIPNFTDETAIYIPVKVIACLNNSWPAFRRAWSSKEIWKLLYTFRSAALLRSYLYKKIKIKISESIFVKLQGQVRAPSKLQKLQLVYLYFIFFFSSLKHIIKTLSQKKEEKDLKIKGVPHDKYTFNSQAKQCLIEKFGLKELFSNGSISIGGLQACFHIAHHYYEHYII